MRTVSDRPTLTYMRADCPDAAVVFVGFAAISVIYYLVRGRANYRGPPDGHTGL
jgi:hypothetical protein